MVILEIWLENIKGDTFAFKYKVEREVKPSLGEILVFGEEVFEDTRAFMVIGIRHPLLAGTNQKDTVIVARAMSKDVLGSKLSDEHPTLLDLLEKDGWDFV